MTVPTAHQLENQQSAAVPHESIDPSTKPEDRPTTALVIELVPGKDGVYKVASQAAGGVQLSDTELALVEAYRAKVQADEAAATAQAEADAAKTTVPAATLSESEQSELAAFRAWQEQQKVAQTGQDAGSGTEDYVPPQGG